MTRRKVCLCGNTLMVLGLIMMVVGVGYSIINQLPAISLPQFLAHGAVFGIFVGGLMWLVGARLSGREKVEDRYYWLRNYGDERCQRQSYRHHHRH